jgi:hypothetical protein
MMMTPNTLIAQTKDMPIFSTLHKLHATPLTGLPIISFDTALLACCVKSGQIT